MEVFEKLKEVSKACGGQGKLAELLGIKPPAISYWKKQGSIPAERIPKLLEIAREHDVEVTGNDLRPDIFPA